MLNIMKGQYGDYAGKYQLYSVAETMIQSSRYSDWWDQNNNGVSSPNEFSMIDHMLVTSHIRDNIVNSYIYHGYDEYVGTYNSDHYPVVIELQF